MSRNYLNSDEFRRDAQRDAMADDARNRERNAPPPPLDDASIDALARETAELLAKAPKTMWAPILRGLIRGAYVSGAK